MSQIMLNESQIAAIFDNTPIILMLFDCRGYLRLINNRARNLLGINYPDVTELSIDSMIRCLSTDSRPITKNISECNCKACELIRAFRDTVSSGNRRVISDIGSTAFSPRLIDGKIYRATIARLELTGESIILMAIEDIAKSAYSESKISGIEMAKSSELYQALFENANDAIFIMKDYTFIECNNRTLKMFGCARDQIIGKPPSDFSPEFQPDGRNSLEKSKEKMQAALEGIPQIFEWLHCRLDKTPFYTEVSLNHIPSLGKTALQAIVRDITERKMAEKALKESEEKFRRIAEHIFDVIVTVSLDGTLTYISPSVERIFGYKSEQLTGKNAYSFVKESEIAHLVELFKQVSRGEYIEGKCLHLRKADDNWADIEIYALPIYKNGVIDGAQAIIRDITETKRLRELESRTQRLETAGKIAGQVAHDFNNLLGPLVAYPALIKDMLPADHPALSFIDDIEAASNKIADINQQMLTLGRRGHYNQEVLNLNPLISQAVRDMGKLPDSITIELDLAPGLMNIKGGNAQIYRAIMNVLANARDAIGDSGKIIVKTENIYVDSAMLGYSRVPVGEYVRVSISDTGPGISPEIAPKIFDPFFTTKTTDKTRGSGLGLSIVGAVMNDHNGCIDLKSDIGQGTTFYLYFPASRESISETNEVDIRGGTESIMVVDDDNLQRTVLSNLLGRLGYNVTTCENGEKAIENLKNARIDLLILDMIMPGGIDGAETYRRALMINPDQKAIIVSGFSETERVRKAQAIGASAFVKKPINLKVLASAVRKALDTKKTVPTQIAVSK